jgi:hypothetical protein
VASHTVTAATLGAEVSRARDVTHGAVPFDGDEQAGLPPVARRGLERWATPRGTGGSTEHVTVSA